MDLTPQTTTRVSRHELALHRYVWLAQALQFGVLSVSVAIIAVLPLGFDELRLFAFAAGLGVVSLIFFFTEPAAIGTVENHLAIASVYVGTGIGMLAFSPHTTVAIAAVCFVGPLTAMRLVDRREIVAHYLAATACLIGPCIYAGEDAGAIVGIVTVLVAIWVLGGCCIMIFEASEAQGEELEDLVRRDPLTGLGNRRLLTEQLGAELKRHQRTRRPLSVLALDLNGFKALNDTLGHAAGDDLLRAVAEALTRAVGPDQVVVRQGGDEFCVILASTSIQSAQPTVNAIKAGLAGITVRGLSVSSGLGVASFPADGETSEQLLHMADLRLTDHKSLTRAAR